MKRLFAIFASLLLAFSLLPGVALADMGPKPSVRIEISGLEPGELCYGTLLSLKPSTGPYSAYDPEEGPRYRDEEGGLEIWQKFVSYDDPDGYHFLQYVFTVSDTGSLDWTYMPPDDFKLLLYFPESDEFVSSGKYTAYAFDSWYDAALEDGGITLERDYPWGAELLNFLARCVLTILLELAIAYFFFRIREKAQVRAVALINLVTQTALNLVVNIIAYYSGSFMLTLRFAMLELLVILAETALYHMFLTRAGADIKLRRCCGLSVAGNLCTYILGVFLARHIPGIF